MFCFKVHKMNETVNKFFLAGDIFMTELHLKQPGFPYSAVAHLRETKKELISSCR